MMFAQLGCICLFQTQARRGSSQQLEQEAQILHVLH